MNKIFTIFILLIFSALKSQNPGGVDGVSIWIKTDSAKTKNLSYKDYSNNLNSIYAQTEKNKPKYSLINYNETLLFDGKDNFIQVPYVFENLDKVNLFTVYQNQNTKGETALFTTDQSGEKELFYSSSNLLRSNNEQINFIESKNLDSLVSFSLYSKFDFPSNKIKEIQGDSGLSNLYIGKDITKKWESFKGKIPEFFIYRRILDQNEQDRINTYLAIKYGITNPFKEYLSSKSVKIWNKEDYVDYSENIAGIARDDYSGLYQKQSKSSSDDNLIIAASSLMRKNVLNQSEFRDQTFLLWGNNKDSLTFSKETLGYQLLKRKWKVRYTADSSERIKTEVLFKISSLLTTIPDGKKFWLLINKEGKDNFNTADIEAIPSSFIDKDGYVHFQNVEFDKDFSNTDVFSFALGGNIFASHELLQPTCKKSTGDLTLKIKGGSLPYTILTKDNKGIVKNSVSEDGLFKIINLEEGEYKIEIRDSKKVIESLIFNIENYDKLKIDLGESRELKIGESIEIDASKNITDKSTQYQWQSSNGYTSNLSKIRVYEPGEYRVTATTSEGCIKTASIMIYKPQGYGIEVYPNPTKSGEFFTIKASLEKPEELNIQIFDGVGRLVKSRKESGKKFYEIKDSLYSQGTYILIIKTETQKKVFKLIID